MALALALAIAEPPAPRIREPKWSIALSLWRSCFKVVGEQLSASNEPVQTIADAAAYECRDIKRVMGEALVGMEHGGRPLSIRDAQTAAATIERDLLEEAKANILWNRSKK